MLLVHNFESFKIILLDNLLINRLALQNNFYFLYFLVIFQFASAQQILSGKITSNIGEAQGVYVINAKTEATVTTDDNGGFVIPAEVGDVLVISSIRFKDHRVVLTNDDFSNLNFTIKLSAKFNQLQEVVIRKYKNINSVSLGIVPSGQRSYSDAERKLQTATALNPTANSNLAGGSVSADGMLNFFSGRTAMLKKELAIEKKESYMKMLEKMFDQNHFINILQIPIDYVKGFEYYAVDNDKFTKILDGKNRTTIEFLLAELANKYKDIISLENKK